MGYSKLVSETAAKSVLFCPQLVIASARYSTLVRLYFMIINFHREKTSGKGQP